MTICTLAFAQTGTEMMQRPIEVSQYRDRASKAFTVHLQSKSACAVHTR